MRVSLPAFLLAASLSAASAAPLAEPQMRLPPSAGEVRVALTLDACGGGVDHRILDVLVENRILATIFVTGKWLKRNKTALATMLAHPDLFEIEDHGLDHVPAVDRPVRIYGIRAAGCADAVRREVEGGRDAVHAAAR